jgi:hypothetical protein
MSEKSSDNLDLVQHLAWCDRNRCTATPSASMGGAHRSTPTTFTAPAGLGQRLEVTASLYQAHTRWLTATYVDLEFFGLEHDWLPISASLHLTTDHSVELGRFLTDLSQIGEAEQAAQVQAYLSALSKEVSNR